MPNPVKTATRGGVLEVTFDRPPANAISADASRALGETFMAFRDDPALRVAILTGGGEKFFSAGWDLKAAAEAGADVDDDHGPGGFGGLTQLFDVGKPVIAAVNGYCCAGGFELALACDLMVTADDAVFFMSEVNLGLIPGIPSIQRLMARLPRAIALEILYTGVRMDGTRMGALGLANRVVPRPQVMAAAREMAETIANAAPLSVAGIKELSERIGHLPPAEGMALWEAGGLPAYDRIEGSEDALEGPRSFAEKRDPVWQGR